MSIHFNLKLVLHSIVLSAGLIACSSSPIAKYEQTEEVLGWENDIKSFEKLDSIETYPKDAILFMGSSSIRLWSTIKEDMAPYPVIQRGYGGARMSDLAVYCNRIVKPHSFRALAIFVANDIVGGEKDKSPEEVLTLYQYIIKQVRKKYQNVPIFFIQITPTNSRWAAWNKISEVNRLIQSYSTTDKNLYFIETEKAFLGDDGMPNSELFIEDQLHLNTKGYEIWTKIIKDNMDRVLR